MGKNQLHYGQVPLGASYLNWGGAFAVDIVLAIAKGCSYRSISSAVQQTLNHPNIPANAGVIQWCAEHVPQLIHVCSMLQQKHYKSSSA